MELMVGANTKSFRHFAFIKLLLIVLVLVQSILRVKSFTLRRLSPKSIKTCREEKLDLNVFYTKPLGAQHVAQTFPIDEDDEKKLAWARHTLMSIAASVMGVPSDVFTTPPMVDPRPPKTSSERAIREKINVSGDTLQL